MVEKISGKICDGGQKGVRLVFVLVGVDFIIINWAVVDYWQVLVQGIVVDV